MKVVLVLFLLYSVLINVQSFHLISKLFNKHHETAPQVTYEEQKVITPAKLLLEYSQQAPVYNVPVSYQEGTKSKDIFNVFGSLKNKFQELFNNKHQFNLQQNQNELGVPIKQGNGQQLVCFPVATQNEVQIKPNVETQLTYEHTIKPQLIQKPVVEHEINPAVLPVFTIPIQQQSSGGKFNIFSKIKEHFHGNNGNSEVKVLLTPNDQTNIISKNDENLVSNPSDVYNSVVFRAAPKEIETEETKVKSQ